MNIEIVKKASQIESAKKAAQIALSDASGLSEEQRDHVLKLLGTAYLLAEPGEEPDARKIREYLRAAIFAEESQRYYNNL